MARVNGITQFLPATHTTILTLLRKHSPDSTTRTRRHTSDIAYYSIYRPRKDKRLSWPSWLTYSGRLTHISGHPSAAGRAWDRESSPVKDQRSNHCATQPTMLPSRRANESYSSCYRQTKTNLRSATDLTIICDAFSFVDPPSLVKLLQFTLLQQFQYRQTDLIPASAFNRCKLVKTLRRFTDEKNLRTSKVVNGVMVKMA